MKNRLTSKVLALMGTVGITGAALTAPAVAQSDLSVTKTAPSFVQAGQNLTYTIKAEALNTTAADNVVVSDPLPSGTTFVAATQTSGSAFTLTQPAVGAGGTFKASTASLSPQAKVNPANLTAFGGNIYFSSFEGTTGTELWKSDGTTTGTMLVKDIYPGSSSSNPQYLTPVGDALYFTAFGGLWKTNGTAAGTVSVKADIYPSYLAAVGNTLYFQAYDSTNGYELWKSDGTTAGTVLLKNISAGSNSSSPTYLTAVGSTLFFNVGGALWKSDGTPEGTVLVKSGVSPFGLAAVGNILYFRGYESVNGYEVWKSDGTEAGTVLLKDIVPGANSSTIGSLTAFNGALYFAANGSLWKSDGSEAGTSTVKADINPASLLAVGNTLYLSSNESASGNELWKSDGTEAGTALVKDIAPGAVSSSPSNLAAVGNTIYFKASATSNTADAELWKSDGTSEGTVTVRKAQAPAIFSLTVKVAETLSGPLSNTASISATSSDPNDANNSSTATTNVTPAPKGDLKLTKSALTAVQAGLNLTYTVTVTNAGPFAAKNVVISDSLPSGTTFVSATQIGSVGSSYPTLNTPTVGQGGTVSFSTSSFDAPTGIGDALCMATFKGQLYFSTTGALWQSDGTTAGTVLLKTGVSARNMVVVGDTLYFAGQNSSDYFGGQQLWKTDGTADGTVLVRSSIFGYSSSSTIPWMVNLNGTLYYWTSDFYDGPALWKSDGTTKGTVQVKRIYPYYYSSSSLQWGVTFNGAIYFSASDEQGGTELWTSDGTAAGTYMLKDIVPGTGSSSPSYLTVVGDKLYFAASGGLWQSDGTSAGTFVVKAGISPLHLVNFNGVIYFQANDGVSGIELWKSNGTEAGTVLVHDIYPGSSSSNPSSLTVVGNTLYFQATGVGSGSELWKSDGTAEGTTLVKDIFPGATGSGPTKLTAFEGNLYFNADNDSYYSGGAMWKSDGTAEGTVPLTSRSFTLSIVVRVSSLATGSITNTATVTSTNDSDTGNNSASVTTAIIPPPPSDLRVIKTAPRAGQPGQNLTYKLRAQSLDANTAYDVVLTDPLPPGTTFVSATQTHGPAASLTKPPIGSNGTVTARIGTLEPSTKFEFPSYLTKFDGALYFSAYNSATGYELWKSDGTDVGTFMVKDIVAGSGNSSPSNLTVFNGALYFYANNGLWKSDGTETGTVLVRANSGYSLLVVNNTLYMTASDNTNGTELWKSDGTAAGSVLVKDIRPGSTGSSISNMTAVGSTLYFRADDGVTGGELWKSDGTLEGTVLVKDLLPGMSGSSPASSNPQSLANYKGTLYFNFYNSSGTYELWKSDGTAAGTVPVSNILPGSGSLSPIYFGAFKGLTYFSGNGGLWKSDGSAAGTVLVKGDINGYIFTPVGDTLFFRASTTVTGYELWKTDGTTQGTVLVKDINPGPDTSNLQSFASFNGLLYFSATDGTNGTELWQSDGTEAGTVPLRSAVSATFDIVVKVDAGVEGTISNTATIGSPHPESNPDNNSSTAITRMPPSLSVSLSSTSPQTEDVLIATPTVVPGEGTYTYSYVWTVTHNGTPTVVRTTTDSAGANDSLNLATAGQGDKGDLISVKVTATETGSGAISPSASAEATVIGMPPTAGGSVSLKEDIATILPLGSDADGDPYTIQLTSLPAHGTLYDGTNADAPVITVASQETPYVLTGTGDALNKVFFVPEANYYGPDSFNLQASDGSTTSEIAPLALTILPVNDAPSFLKGSNQVAWDNAGVQIVTGWATARSAGPSNEAEQSLDFLVSNDNSALFAVQPALSADGTLSYTPQQGVSGAATVTVKLHDNGGVQNGGVDTSAAQTFILTIRQSDSIAPTVVQTTPFVNQNLSITAFKSGSLTGTASDNIGITKVEVKITRLRNGVTQIWNGTAWGTANVRVPATITATAPNATSVTWGLYQAFPPEAELDAGQYIILVYANDAVGNTGSTTNRLNLYPRDIDVPITQVFTPILNQKILISDFKAGVVTGNASDNIGVNTVRLRLSRKRNGVNQYWNGSAFTTSAVFLNVPVSSVGATTTKWNLDSQMPPIGALDSGLYQIEAYATDSAGNKSLTVVRPFTLGADFTAPSVAITTPTSGQRISLSAFGAGTITGTAADNLGVTSVKVKLSRKRGTVTTYWNGSAFTTAVATVDAVVTTVGGTSVTWKLDQVPTPASGLDAGAYTLYASSYDAAGNTKSSASRGFTLTAAVAPTSSVSASSAGGS